MSKTVVSEVVLVFKEGNVPVAVLRQNGTTEFFVLRHANKEQVAQLLDADKTE